MEQAPKLFLEQLPELHPVVAQILYDRGLRTEADVNHFLHPDYLQDQHDPFLFRDMKKVVARILLARDQHQQVLVYGDYDADGVCAAVLLYTALQQAGVKNVRIYLPHRDTEGYGLNMPAVERFHEEGVDLIITVDCAISNAAEVAAAAKFGMDVIVTDHHVEPPQLPTAAFAIVNPQIKSDTYPFAKLAGVGVAFKVAQALGRTLQLGEPYEKWLLDLVAISTITDCMPLLDENRTLVHYGLIVLNKTRNRGLRALIKATHNDGASVTTTGIGYRLGPWINAAGRIDHANMAVSLLLADTEEKASEFTQKLGETNAQRQLQTEKMFQQAKAQAEQQVTEPVLHVFHEDWALGLVGLVAGKLVNAFHKPAFVMTANKGEVSGSGRSLTGLNMIATLQQMDPTFSRYGGHAMACGFTLKKDITTEQFAQHFIELAKPILAELDSTPKLNISATLALSDINWELVQQLDLLQPFGEQNPEPQFLLDNVSVKDWQLVGAAQQHLRLQVTDTTGKVVKAIAFGSGDIAKKLSVGCRISVVCKLGVNQWNGNKEIQISVSQINVK